VNRIIGGIQIGSQHCISSDQAPYKTFIRVNLDQRLKNDRYFQHEFVMKELIALVFRISQSCAWDG